MKSDRTINTVYCTLFKCVCVCVCCSVVPGCNNMLDFWIFILLHFVITLEAPLDVEQAAVCGSSGEGDGPPRTGNIIDSQGRLMLWGI